jgi:2-phosphosulfolactate phosphatase
VLTVRSRARVKRRCQFREFDTGVDKTLYTRGLRGIMLDQMKISVALTPQLLREPKSHAIAVVDVLRATSSLVAMFDSGLLRAIIADNLRDARNLALRNFSLLCGEAKALPIPGFDYGNSPAEFAGLSLKGKSAVLWTTNSTKAIAAASPSPAVAVAALTNRRAAAARVLDEAAKRGLDIAIVCAGLDRGTVFGLEDSVSAGAIVEAVHEADSAVVMTDSAWEAMHLWQWYRGDAMRAFRQSVHGRALLAMGFEHDLAHAAQVDVSNAVPMLTVEDGVKTLRIHDRRQKHVAGAV